MDIISKKTIDKLSIVTAPTATFYNSKAADTPGSFVNGLTPTSSAFVTGVTAAEEQNAYTASVSGHVLTLNPANTVAVNSTATVISA